MAINSASLPHSYLPGVVAVPAPIGLTVRATLKLSRLKLATTVLSFSITIVIVWLVGLGRNGVPLRWVQLTNE